MKQRQSSIGVHATRTMSRPLLARMTSYSFECGQSSGQCSHETCLAYRALRTLACSFNIDWRRSSSTCGGCFALCFLKYCCSSASLSTSVHFERGFRALAAARALAARISCSTSNEAMLGSLPKLGESGRATIAGAASDHSCDSIQNKGTLEAHAVHAFDEKPRREERTHLQSRR